MAAGEITIKTSEYRPCFVTEYTANSDNMTVRRSEKKALFHRWEDRAEIIYKCPFGVSEERFEHLKKNRWPKDLIPGGIDIERIRHTYAIVEYENGTIAEVEPSAVRFVKGIFEDYCFE